MQDHQNDPDPVKTELRKCSEGSLFGMEREQCPQRDLAQNLFPPLGESLSQWSIRKGLEEGRLEEKRVLARAKC